MNIARSKSIERYMELQCNNNLDNYMACPEIKNVSHLLRKLTPKNVLEICAGL